MSSESGLNNSLLGMYHHLKLDFSTARTLMMKMVHREITEHPIKKINDFLKSSDVNDGPVDLSAVPLETVMECICTALKGVNKRCPLKVADFVRLSEIEDADEFYRKLDAYRLFVTELGDYVYNFELVSRIDYCLSEAFYYAWVPHKMTWGSFNRNPYNQPIGTYFGIEWGEQEISQKTIINVVSDPDDEIYKPDVFYYRLVGRGLFTANLVHVHNNDCENSYCDECNEYFEWREREQSETNVWDGDEFDINDVNDTCPDGDACEEYKRGGCTNWHD